MLTNKQLVDFVIAKTKVKSAYMWGDFGRPITEATISSKARQYPNRYTATRQAKLRKYIGKGYIGCDCCGLYKYFLWTSGGTTIIKYNSATDRGTEGMYSVATKKGMINTLPEIPGLILYMKGHVGVYIGNGYAVECTLGSYGDGIVKTKVSGRGWTHWLKMPDLQYIAEVSTPTKKSIEEIAKEVINGKWGNGAARKTALEKAGYNYTEVQNKVNELLKGSSAPKETYVTMKVSPSSGLYYHNAAKWSSKTRLGCWTKGTSVKVVKGSEYRYGTYTGCKVLYKGKYVYCAKDYLV